MTGCEIIDMLAGECPQSLRCRVCIIGAGAAGAYVARRLADQGLDVVVLEAGDARSRDAVACGFEPQFEGESYPSALEGRAFGLGGTTSRWGGLLVPHSCGDYRDDGPVDVDIWRHIVETVNKNSGEVLSRLGFSGDAAFHTFAEDRIGEEVEHLRRAGLQTITSLFLPFRKKNLFHLLEQASGTVVPRVVSSATVTQWRFDEHGRVRQIEATTLGEHKVTVNAEEFIVAAGTIESARVLLEIRQQAPTGVRLSDDVGKYLGDHLSVAIADVDRRSLSHVIATYAPRFSGDWMRSFRFVDADPKGRCPRGFAHLVFENENAGFKLAKSVLTAMQARRLPSVSVGDILRGSAGVAGLAFDRFLRSRLYISKNTKTRLQIDIEQEPNPDNCIRLADDLDQSGRPRIIINWRIHKGDMDQLRQLARRILERWENVSALPRLLPRDLSFTAEKPHDAYHPVGVCRMGFDDESVVSPELRVRGIDNLWLVSTGVLPSAGTANPTFTMLCLADNCVDRLVHTLRENAA